MATLAERHVEAQQRISRLLADAVKREWTKAVAGRVPTASMSEQFIARMLPLIRMYRDRSEGHAARFYERERFAAVPDASPFSGARADEVPDEAIITSLTVTGLVRATQALEQVALAEALELAQTSLQGAVSRITLNAGRSYSLNAFTEDRLAVAYFRQTGPGCCSFCAMLASRGAVYREDSFEQSDPRFFGPGNAKVHDECGCVMGTLWRRDTAAPDFNTSMRRIWDEVTRGKSGQAAQNAFRNVYEAQFGRRD